MSEAGYAIVTWAGLAAVLAIAYWATRMELLKVTAIGLAGTLVFWLAVAGFVLVAAI